MIFVDKNCDLTLKNYLLTVNSNFRMLLSFLKVLNGTFGLRIVKDYLRYFLKKKQEILLLYLFIKVNCYCSQYYYYYCHSQSSYYKIIENWREYRSVRNDNYFNINFSVTD